MNKIYFKLSFLILAVGAGALAAYLAFAQVASPSGITFPVAELNNCRDQTECKAYCDKPENIDACVSFAQKHGLISDQEASTAKQFKDVLQNGGPGGCTNQGQCETYCNDSSHLDECINFAEQHNLMSPSDLSEAKKVDQALKQGAQLPGNCRGKQQCQDYCKIPDHSAECLDFASKAGFIPPDQAAQARKMAELVQSGDAPQVCLEGKDQCQQYCSEDAHRDQCANFMVKAGFINEQDAALFKKTGGKGPGGCQGKEECDAFCKAPENQQACFQFGKDNGLIPPDQLKQIQDNLQQAKSAIDNAPPEVKQCLQSSIDPNTLQQIESGNFIPSQDAGEKLGQQMQKCFEQFMPKNNQGPSGNQGQSGFGGPVGASPENAHFSGPGGCSTPEECAQYCSAHPSECGNFGNGQQPGQPAGQFPPAGPGGNMPGNFPNGQQQGFYNNQEMMNRMQQNPADQLKNINGNFGNQSGSYLSGGLPPIGGSQENGFSQQGIPSENNYNQPGNYPPGSQGMTQPMPPQGTQNYPNQPYPNGQTVPSAQPQNGSMMQGAPGNYPEPNSNYPNSYSPGSQGMTQPMPPQGMQNYPNQPYPSGQPVPPPSEPVPSSGTAPDQSMPPSDNSYPYPQPQSAPAPTAPLPPPPTAPASNNAAPSLLGLLLNFISGK